MKKVSKCNLCVMDSTAVDFIKYNDGCSFCNDYKKIIKKDKKVYSQEKKNNLINKIKSERRGKYDCIIGVSGGVDSSWVLVKAIECGLKPLAVHMDNGWNSELAQNNISNLIRKLDVDLVTHVINWTEYRELMNQFFKANVIDVELLYDNAMLAVNYQLAKKFKIKYILSGMNSATEGMRMPENWNWFKYDKRQINYFSKLTNNKKLITFPSIGTINFLKYHYLHKIRWIHFLNYFDFEKEKALNHLEKRFQYKRYPYKHYESVFTRFYQGYILPKKFNVDKRKLHLSTLIISNQMKRNKAIQILKSKPYNNFDLESDKDYFLKKMKWSYNDLNKYIDSKEISHLNYPTEIKFWNNLIKLKSLLK